MQQFEHIQSIWHSHSVDIKLSSDEMLIQAKKEVANMRTKSALNIAGMVAAIIAIVVLWVFLDFNSWLAPIALTIVIATITIYVFILYKDYRLISKTDFTVHPSEFLTTLKVYQLSRLQLYNRLYWVYVAALSIGIGLYYLEVAENLELWAQIMFSTFCLLWIIFCSTIFRKAVLKKEKEKIDTLIDKVTRVSGQF